MNYPNIYDIVKTIFNSITNLLGTASSLRQIARIAALFWYEDALLWQGSCIRSHNKWEARAVSLRSKWAHTFMPNRFMRLGFVDWSMIGSSLQLVGQSTKCFTSSCEHCSCYGVGCTFIFGRASGDERTRVPYSSHRWHLISCRWNSKCTQYNVSLQPADKRNVYRSKKIDSRISL